MGYHDRQNMILSKEASQLIKTTKILVVGAGAGGNEVLKNLILMGFGNITIVDFDYIEDSNLSRTTLFRKEDIGLSKAEVAAKRLQELALHENPNIVGLHGNLMTDIGKKIFWDHDIVICCVDTQKARAYLSDWCVISNTPYFEMGFSEYDVDICFFAPTGDIIESDGTYRPNFPPSDGLFPKFAGSFPVCLREVIGIDTFEEKRNSCSGYKVRDTGLSKIPTIQVSAATAGVLIATEIIKYLDGKDSIRNKMLMFYGRTYNTLILNYTRNPKCSIHSEKIDEILEIEVDINTTIGEFVHKIERKLSAQILLYLPDSFVVSSKCHICGDEIVHNKRKSQLWHDEKWCNKCKNSIEDYLQVIECGGETKIYDSEISKDSDIEILSLKMSDISIPMNDILKVLILSEGSIKAIYVTNKLN